MRKTITALFSLVILLCATQLASAADFFDSSKWYLDSTQWDQYAYGDVNNEITITDQNGRLEFASTRDTTANGNAYRTMVSQWALDLNKNFSISIDYHQSAPNPVGVDGYSKLNFNLLNGDFNSSLPVDPDYIFYVGARSSLTGEQDLAGEGVMMTPTVGVVNTWARTLADGMFTAQYNALLDQLVMTDVATGGNIIVNELRNTYHIKSLKLALNAGSDGFSYEGKDAYFQNLNVVVTPEPISSVLFIVGGGAMAFARRRMKVNA